MNNFKNHEEFQNNVISRKPKKRNTNVDYSESNLQPEYGNIYQENQSQFSIFIASEKIQNFINAEKSDRLKNYSPVKHILAVGTLGMSYYEMVSGYKIENSIDFRLDKALKFQEGTGKEAHKKYCGIKKTCTDMTHDDYIPDRFQALIQWEGEEYVNELWISPLSVTDTRMGILLLMQCVAYRNCTPEEVMQEAISHYNKNYKPMIDVKTCDYIHTMFDSTCGHRANSNLGLFLGRYLQALYYNDSKNFLVFTNEEDTQVMDEQKIVENQFLDVKKDDITNPSLKRIKTNHGNKELIKYDYENYYRRKGSFFSKKKKMEIKRQSFEDRLCVQKTLRQLKVFVKNNIGVKLAKVDFLKEFQRMDQYNQILKVKGCWFEFRGCGFCKINRYTEFRGNSVVIRLAEIYSKFHMLPLKKGKIPEISFREDPFLKDKEDEFFEFFQYQVENENKEKKKAGRKKGLKILGKLD